MQSPFIQQVPPQLPVVIKPLKYCEFRQLQEHRTDYTSPDVTTCPVFASEKIEGMFFCYQHGLVILAALAAESGGE